MCQTESGKEATDVRYGWCLMSFFTLSLSLYLTPLSYPHSLSYPWLTHTHTSITSGGTHRFASINWETLECLRLWRFVRVDSLLDWLTSSLLRDIDVRYFERIWLGIKFPQNLPCIEPCVRISWRSCLLRQAALRSVRQWFFTKQDLIVFWSWEDFLLWTSLHRFVRVLCEVRNYSHILAHTHTHTHTHTYTHRSSCERVQETHAQSR